MDRMDNGTLPPCFSAPYGLLRVRLAEGYPVLYCNGWLRSRLPACTQLADCLSERVLGQLDRALRLAGDGGEVDLELEVFGENNRTTYLLLGGAIRDGLLDAAVLDITAWRMGERSAPERPCRAVAETASTVMTFDANITRDQLTDADAAWYRRCGLAGLSTYSGLLRAVCEKALYPQHRAQFAEQFGRETVLCAFAEGKREIRYEYVGVGLDRQPIWLEATMTLLRDRATEDVCGLLHIKNIDRRKKQEQELRRRAERDELTGVLNRQAVQAQIDRVLAESAGTGRRCALLMIDLDNFKRVNDTYGHVQGDTVLSGFAARLRGIFRETDVIGRIGGDEFVILVRDIPQRDTAARKAAQVCGVMQSDDPMDNPPEGEISGSVGIAFSPDDGVTFEELYYKADIALYRAKRQGKNCCAAYDRARDML